MRRALLLPEVQTYRRLAQLTAASQRWPTHQRIRCGSTLLLCSLSLGGGRGQTVFKAWEKPGNMVLTALLPLSR